MSRQSHSISKEQAALSIQGIKQTFMTDSTSRVTCLPA
jgi:hypothetical protein